MKIMTRDEYMDGGGAKCPVCGSEDIRSGSGLEAQGRWVSQNVWCYDCNSEWVDIYDLTGYGELHDKDGNSLED
jgi:transposase-like protein